MPTSCSYPQNVMVLYDSSVETPSVLVISDDADTLKVKLKSGLLNMSLVRVIVFPETTGS